MPIARIFQKILLTEQLSLTLTPEATHHVARVLRAKVSDELILFNGEGNEYLATITAIDKKTVHVNVSKLIERHVESTLNISLAQGISKGDKMDFTIQKAVELGVTEIFPLITERCNFKLTAERAEKKLAHWQSIIISACEQSGRTSIPKLYPIQTLTTFLAHAKQAIKLVLSPHALQKLGDVPIKKDDPVILLIGPEGGLSPAEIQTTIDQQFIQIQLGPRILRTETAGLAAITALQCYAGDLI